jgi:hypothetical protein
MGDRLPTTATNWATQQQFNRMADVRQGSVQDRIAALEARQDALDTRQDTLDGRITDAEEAQDALDTIIDGCCS